MEKVAVVNMNNNNTKALSHKKQFGQFFSGEKVADLLASLLPDDVRIKNVIDPMAGIGDMLYSIKKCRKSVSQLVGIEIDEPIVSCCKEKNPSAEILSGDAFSINIPTPRDGWDLVMTNPPYVRYQISNMESDGQLPTFDKIRKNLINSLMNNAVLSTEEKDFFLNLATSYSGLSDIAVPSWILCASLVKKDGILAMVVPETWLSREYALPIQHMLLRCFDIISITSDMNAAWFESAQVKTCLVIARRKKLIELSMALGKETQCLKIGKALIGPKELVENLTYNGLRGIQALKYLMHNNQEFEEEWLRIYTVKTYTLFPLLFTKENQDVFVQSDHMIFLPPEMRMVVDGHKLVDYITIEQLGWSVGQGLRTGANDFFYCNELSDLKDINMSMVEATWYPHPFKISHNNLMVALRNRNQVQGLCVRAEKLQSRLLYLKNEIRPSDFDLLNPELSNKFKPLNSDTSEYITAAESFSPSSRKACSCFKDRSAVRTNEKKDLQGVRQFWYMLPTLALRHLPKLCLPRVCGGPIECLFVNQEPNSSIVVDANFSTLWGDEQQNAMAVFALLNSTWFKCYIESMCTVMGGGALKVEASNIKKVYFPQYSKAQLLELSKCGETLINTGVLTQSIAEKIDDMVLAPYGKDSMLILSRLKNTLRKLLSDRGCNVGGI